MCVNVSERRIIVDVSVCAHSRFQTFLEERGSPLHWTARDILKQTGCYPSGPEDVSQKEKEEA